MQRNTFGIHDTFDTKVALSGFYLWLLFGFLNHSVSCDLQRLMQRNLIFRHVVSIVSFFLLFTVIDTSNKAPVYLLLLKTLFIYFLFLVIVCVSTCATIGLVSNILILFLNEIKTPTITLF